MRRLLLAAALLLGSASPVWAQALAGSVLITQVDSSAFPAMTVYLAVNDAGGQRPSGLASSAFTLTENDASAAGLTVTEEETGVQVVFVLDPSPAFDARDAAGVTRLEYLQQALTAYASAAPGMKEGVDNTTLLTPLGAPAEHSLTGAEVAAAVAGMGADLASAADPLPLLNRAVDYAAEPALNPGARRYVVYFSTGLVIADHQAAVNDLAVRANAAQIQIDTVYVGPVEGAAAAGGQGLQQLARLTNGAFYQFERPASLTPLFQLLAEQRTQYKLSYRSGLNVTGQHNLIASVNLPAGEALTSLPSTVALRIEPPLVTLGGLPAEMEQTLTSVLVPFAVDFVDGHPRAVRAYQLVVDEVVVDRQTVVAGLLRWPTTGYTQSGEHTVTVRATDELGLTGESAPLTVTVNVNASVAAAARSGLFRLLSLAALAGAGLLALGLFFVARTRMTRARTLTASSAPAPGPVPKSVLAPGDTQPRRPMANVLDDTRPVKPVTIKTPPARVEAQPWAPEQKQLGRAYLEVLDPGGGGAPRPNIEILKSSLKIGRDPAQSEIVFNDRSVSRLHARLEDMGGLFRLFDERSTSGTWVNLEQIPAEGGRDLKDGDVINLGRVQLRFKRRT